MLPDLSLFEFLRQESKEGIYLTYSLSVKYTLHIMSENKQIIRIRIRDLRREHSLTQEELAAALGLSRQSINAMEAGRCLPSLPVALQIATYFSVPVQTVFGVAEEIVNNQPADENLEPGSPIHGVRHALGEIMGIPTSSWPLQVQEMGPAICIYQNAEFVFAEVLVPGYPKDMISLEVGDDFLSVSAEGVPEKEDFDVQYFRREFLLISFSRTVPLPAIVRGNEAQAEIKNGVLLVQIPKLIEERPKATKIVIKSEE